MLFVLVLIFNTSCAFMISCHSCLLYFVPLQIRNETPELSRGAAKALYDLYEVVTHDLLSSDLR